MSSKSMKKAGQIHLSSMSYITCRATIFEQDALYTAYFLHSDASSYHQNPFAYHVTLPLAAQYALIENVTVISRMGILTLPSVMQITNLNLNH